MAEISIDSQRLWKSLMDLAKIGATEKGGVRRLALSKVDGEARDVFIRWCKDAGCSVAIDGIGNIFARRPGRNDGLPPIITGSHIDTQPSGGKFDGNYGVMAVMTAAFAVGQILGPVLVSIVAGDPRGMDLTLVAASVVLILGVLVLSPINSITLHS